MNFTNYLLDTNVVSEWVKPRPDPGVVTWLANADEDRVCLSVMTLAELRHGIARMETGARRTRLNTWLCDELPLRFEGRLFDITPAIADAWGRIVAERQSAGHSIGTMDAFLAATARVHDLTIITRNVTDFAHSDCRIVNPWSE
jgi:predicted nucleic acid-binding protein